MAVKKLTWEELMREINPNAILENQGLITKLNNCDIKISGLNGVSKLVNAFTSVREDLLDPEDTIWKGMKIAVSSFKIKDKRPILLILQKLGEYTGFLDKILTDEGFTAKFTTSRNYINNSSNNSLTKGYDSETPQIELTNFEEGIKYASQLNKTDSQSQIANTGSETNSGTSNTFKENVENTKYLFFNDLVNYIIEIPNKIYSMYSLESLPFTEIQCEYIKHLKELYKNE